MIRNAQFDTTAEVEPCTVGIKYVHNIQARIHF